MKIYAFDVDETLWLSGGPILEGSLNALWVEGHMLGLCGNWAVVAHQLQGWYRLFSFFNAGVDKASFLIQLKMSIPAEEYIFVGNVQGVSGASDDAGAATAAGWRFISERDFAVGAR